MSTGMDPIRNTSEGWVRKFVPERRIFTGSAYLFAKRLFDLTLTILTAPFWIPLMVVIALIIRITSPGAPALFTQLRTDRKSVV